MERFIKFFQAVGVTALVVAITVGYGTVQGASAQWPWCEDTPECHEDTPGNVGHHACMTSDCDSRDQWCCLDEISN